MNCILLFILNSPGGQERISEYMVISPEKLAAFFAELRPEEITFLGDGTSMLPNNLQDVLDQDV